MPQLKAPFEPVQCAQFDRYDGHCRAVRIGLFGSRYSEISTVPKITSSARASRVAGTSRPSALAVYQERRPANTLSRYHHEISRVSAYLIMAASVSGPTMPSMSPW